MNKPLSPTKPDPDTAAPAAPTPISPIPLYRNGSGPLLPFTDPSRPRRRNVGRTYR